MKRSFALKSIVASGRKSHGQKDGSVHLSTMQGEHFVPIAKKELVPRKSELLKQTKTALHVQCSKTVVENRPMEAFVTTKEPSVVKAELNVVSRSSARTFPLTS